MLLLGCLLGLAGAGVLLVTLGMDRVNLLPLGGAVAMLGVAAGTLRRHARRDPQQAVGLAATGALVLALLSGAMVTLGDRPHLLTYAPVALASAEVRPGGPLPILVLAQNGWDRDRFFTLALHPERRLAFDQGHFAVPPPARVLLPPGACAEVVVVGVAPLSPPGRHPLLVLPGVEGEGGARVRHRGATTYQPPVSPALTALGALAGAVFGGGGIRVQATVVGVATGEIATTEVRSTLVYVPGDDVLTRARS